MKIYIKSGMNELTFDLCACDHEKVHPNNLIPLPVELSSNKMNEVGIFHNLGLDQLRKLGVRGNADRTIEASVKFANSYSFATSAKKFVGEFDEEEFIEKFRSNIIDGCILDFPPKRWPDYFDDFLKDLFLGVGHDLRNFDKTSDVHAIYHRLLDAEQQIAKSDMSNSDKNGQLASVALATNTIHYWHTQALEKNGETKNSANANSAAVDPFLLIRKATADAVAFNEASSMVNSFGAAVFAFIASAEED